MIAVDAQGFVTQVNPAATRLLGVSADEIEGSAVAVLASEIDGMLGLAAALGGHEVSEQQLSVRRRAAAPLPVSVAVARDPSQAIPLYGSYVGDAADDLGMTVTVRVRSVPSPDHPLAAEDADPAAAHAPLAVGIGTDLA